MAARDLLVRVLGDTRDVEAAFARSSRAATSFGASVEGTGRKADKAARNLSGFAKGALAGFGGAIAFTEGIRALRSVIDAASESQQVLGQTRVALESTGKSWQQYGEQIEDAIAAQSRLGFDDEALFRTFSLFIRQSRDVGEAIRRNNIAMNLARARFIDLEQAANLVNKAALGQAGALRRVGIDARNGASGVELLTQLERQFAGAAEEASNSAVGATDRFKVSIENVQESLGGLLLPKVAELADTTSNAADRVGELVDALNKLGAVKIPPIKIPLILDTGTGGGTDIGALFGKAKDAAITGFETQFPGLKFVRDLADLIAGTPTPDTKAAADAFDAKFESFMESLEQDLDGSMNKANNKIKAFGQKGFKPLETNELGATLQRQFDAALDALDLQFDQARFAGSDQAALAALDKIEATIRRRIESQGRTTELLRQLFEVEKERATILREGREQAQAAAKEAQALAREQEKAAREAQRALEQSNQFRAIGLSATGGEITPTVANLRKQFEQLSKNVVGQDVSSKLLARLKLVGNALAGGIKKMTPETRAAIKDLFDAIRSEFDEQTQKDIIPPRRVQISDKILRALGFDEDAQVAAFRGVRELARNAPIFPTGMRPFAVTAPASSAPLPPLHVHVEVDGQEVGHVLIRDLQKRAARTTGTSRGRYAGKGLGLG